MGLQEIIGPNIKIEVDVVEKISLSKSGKFKWIISKISKDSLSKGMH
ncbi:MAG: hypothetical protein HQ538_01655 [Parcubacteria group bacterium]|nr:hypothetical protein [Parcubacteria group bacterium]